MNKKSSLQSLSCNLSYTVNFFIITSIILLLIVPRGLVVKAADLPKTSSVELFTHFDAGKGVLSEDAGELSPNLGTAGFWEDLSGNGFHARQSNPDKQPFLVENILNGKPVLRFYGAHGPHARFQGRDYSMLVHFTEQLKQPNTVFIVVNTRNVLDGYIFDGNNSQSRQFLAVDAEVTKQTWKLGSPNEVFSSPVMNGDFLIHTLLFNGSGTEHYINGLLTGTYDTGSGSLTGIHIGGRYDDSYHADMDLAEILIYKGAAGEKDRLVIEEFLSEKYGLASNCQLSATVEGNLAAEPKFSDVFWQGMNDIHTYRIPSVVTTQSGVILAFAEARKITWVDKSPTKLVVRRSLDGGETWLPVQDIIDIGNDAAMDPTSVVDRITGRIWLFFTVWPEEWDPKNPIKGFKYPSCTVWLTFSDDEGVSWSNPLDITRNVKLPEWSGYNIGPGIGIQLQKGFFSGRLLVPASGGHSNHLIYSDDHGKTWGITGSIEIGSESQVIELFQGRLLMNMRGGGRYGRHISLSSDTGANWSRPYYDSYLIEPVGIGGSNCQAAILRYTFPDLYAKGRILFSNPASGAVRQNLTIRISYDECSTWKHSRLLWPGASGYSCLTVLPDKRVGVLFESGKTYSAEKITFASFSLEWLTKNADNTE